MGTHHCLTPQDSELHKHFSVRVHTDWSRTTRRRLALLKSASDPNQQKITSFMQIVDRMTKLIEETPEIMGIMETVTQDQGRERDISTVSPLLKQLLLNAERNVQKFPHQRRHEEVLKKFATSLFIFSGPLAYEFLQQNLPEALPSLRTVQRIVSSEYRPLHEGEFRFDELLAHLTSYKAPKVVAIGEDATRVISRVEYDNDTDRLVGFVLPCNENGLPLSDAFIAVSFESMEEFFRVADVAKYAFVYMAQPLCKGVPAFCLACMGTNNKFTADLVLKRWLYMFSECKKRGITVASFGADGDSRELKAMQVSAQLLFTSRTLKSLLSPSSSLQKLPIPSEWLSWFAVRKPTAIAYIQDIVHVAVKLKSRLLKPSIVLPLGKYLAGVHHLRLVQRTFGKEQHGLRERDIDHKDKQNYDAVMHMTSKACMALLSQIPDAKGTHSFLEVIQCVTDSFLDKDLDAPSRVEKAWYAVFFMRYWRQWLLFNPHYTLGNNFITLNAYMCIELNAHSLITFLMTVRDSLQPDSQCFVPWMLGSQSCEKIFRAARSMSSTFSTVINFAMLGLLRRLHRLHIQFCLQTESQETGIKYPRSEAHKSKDGHQKPSTCNVHSITNEQIVEAVTKARHKAKERVEALGMAELLQKKKCWDNPPIPAYVDEELCDDDDCDEEELAGDGDDEAHSSQDPTDVASAICQLSSNGVIGEDLTARLTVLHRSSFKRLTGPTLPMPMFQIDEGSSKGKMTKRKHCPFVEVQHAGKTLFVNKTTAVWLLQEGERVSSDRLFRVRCKQPYTSDSEPQIHSTLITYPEVCQTLEVSNICVFKESQSSWKIGRVLQFSHYLEKTKTAQQYRGTTASVTDKSKKIGVLCAWYTLTSPPAKFTMVESEEAHAFFPITSYICTLPHGCFEKMEKAHDVSTKISSIQKCDPKKLDLATAYHLTLTKSALVHIQTLLEPMARDTSSSSQPADVITIDDDTQSDSHASASATDGYWTEYGRVVLRRKELQEIMCGKELTDLHVNAFQNLLKRQFPLIGGLQSTLLQTKSPLQHKESGEMLLQIIHTRGSHWAALQICGKDVYLYDSAYTSVTTDTLDMIAQLLRSKDHCIQIQIMNVAKQTGTTDCGLYAIAIITCLALGMDPVSVVFKPEELRPHFVKVLETGTITAFPVVKHRRPTDRVKNVEVVSVYCYCRLPDNGEAMVSCDKCEEWYHIHCITGPMPTSTPESWFCDNCKPGV